MLRRSSLYNGSIPLKKVGILFASILFCLIAVSPSLFGQVAFAQDGAQGAEPVNTPAPVEKPVLVTKLAPEFQVNLEGEVLDVEVSKDQNGVVLVRAEPIFTALDDEFEYDVEGGVLIVQRSQDGVIMELYTDTGVVKANGRTLGKLQQFGLISAQSINLTPNAIAVMSGAIGKIDAEENRINFNLDPRLKVATGFEMIVNDVPLGNVEPGPKAIGPVLLLPLRPIAKELGHTVQIIDSGTSIKVKRSQDSAEFELNLDTGLVKLNGRPVGVSKDVTYFDKINLLLPVGTIESLTGTHVDVEDGARINISLDNRLKDIRQPDAKINDVTKETPFTLETIKFHVGTDTINSIETDFRVKGFNGRLRYEIPDIPSNTREAEPSWLSLDYAHVKGGHGSLGDYSADHRELDGVGLRRIRGVSYVKEGDKGRWAFVAGVPTVGTTKISEDQNRLSFGGAAAGARYASKDGWEAGVSLKSDGLSDDQMVVLSAISGRLGRGRDKKLNWDARSDVGYFNGAARENTIDARASATVRYEVNKKINVEAFASYDGAEFLRSDLNAEELVEQEAIQEQEQNGDTPADTTELFVPDIRRRGQDHASYGVAVQATAGQVLGPLERPAISARYSHSQSGMFVKNGNDISTDNYGVSVNTSLRKIGTNISADFTGYSQKQADGTAETGDQITARIYQNTKYATARGQYTSFRKGDAERIERFDAQLSARPYKLGLPKDAVLSVAPSVSASWSKDSNFARGGIVANLNSGQILGKKTKLTASMGVLQNFSGNASDRSDKFLSVSLGRVLRINKNLALGLSYRNDLNGDQRVGVFMDRRFGFTEKRKFREADDGRGVLKGRAFLDKNRDGIKQEDEPGVGGALIRVKNSRMALRTDIAGYYTIQNIKIGIHELQIDGRSLPLGYSLAEGISTKASIHEGHITDVSLPIVQRGQIRGFAFIDKNNDGAYNKGEARLEGARLALTDTGDTENHFEIYTTSFGQYAFDDLPAGEYELAIKKTNSPLGDPSSEPIIINLAAEEDLMARINIAAMSTSKNTKPVQMAEQNSEPDNIGDRVQEPKEEISPPDIPDENIPNKDVIVVSPAP